MILCQNPKTLSKQNPKLLQKELRDGRASLYLEYYLGRHETPVLDENGNHDLCTDRVAMAGRPKYKVTHERRKESLNLYLWISPRNPQKRLQNRNTIALAENTHPHCHIMFSRVDYNGKIIKSKE